MARVRSIHPGATLEEDVATMSMAARLAWAYLPCHADREGRLKDSAFTLKAAIFPADNLDMEAVLAELAERKHIIRYEANGRRYIQIRNFDRYQAPHVRETASAIPAPTLAVPGQVQSTTKAVPSTPIPDLSPDLSPEREKGPPATEPITAELWDAERWLAAFKRAYEAKGITGATAFYGQTSDGKALATLSVELAKLPPGVKLEAQANGAAMFAAFFANGNDETRKRLWPFSFFVQAFGELRMKAAKPRPPNNARPPDAGPAIPAAMRSRPTETGATHGTS